MKRRKTSFYRVVLIVCSIFCLFEWMIGLVMNLPSIGWFCLAMICYLAHELNYHKEFYHGEE